ncbi:hypothetical protein [Kineococcus sp. SYSU DK005]|uniref:hypothetical protein n=1 Tax=Kineococcus sp. SYSU DK005 TaxID=3383126 RepID=UPI003D7CFDC8
MNPNGDPHPNGSLLGEHIALSNGYRLGWAVGPDGRTWPWLVAPTPTATDPSSRRCWDASTAHENTGPLPAAIAALLATTEHARCGAHRRDGGTCRAYVTRAGDRCRHHPDHPATTTNTSTPRSTP